VIKVSIKRFARMAMLVVPIVALATSASAATEKEHHPTGDFAKFAQCPTEAAFASVLCAYSEAYGGEIQIGHIDTPITKPIALQGGLTLVPEGGELEFFALPAVNGESLLTAPQVVPGGIFALVKEGRYPWFLRNFCRNFPNNSECKLTATPELAGRPLISILAAFEQEGTVLEIPLKLHLKNPFLGGKCYIGSASSPVTVALTTGSMPALGTEPGIIGKSGELEFLDEQQIITLKQAELVDNAFSAPAAEGCGGPQSLIVDREIDEKQGLPAPAGHNRARLLASLSLASTEGVSKSEE
jgi:hypothetical protein